VCESGIAFNLDSVGGFWTSVKGGASARRGLGKPFLRADEDTEQVSDPAILLERVPQRKVGEHRVVVSSTPALAQYVARVDQLRQDPVSGAFGDPDRGRDVTQADAGVMSDAGQHMRVVREEVPAARGPIPRWHFDALAPA
jgi:hypothetical protein